MNREDKILLVLGLLIVLGWIGMCAYVSYHYGLAAGLALASIYYLQQIHSDVKALRRNVK